MASNKQEVQIPLKDIVLPGSLTIPDKAKGIIAFVYGRDGRYSSGNRYLASELENAGFATLLFDLFTDADKMEDGRDAERFEVELLTKRLMAVTDWLKTANATGGMATGYFAAGTGAAAALNVAAKLGNLISAVVSRGGRPDLASPMKSSVVAPTMLIVGKLDPDMVEFNERALAEMRAEREISIVKGAGRLFEEEGKLEEVSRLANSWFDKYIVTKGAS